MARLESSLRVGLLPLLLRSLGRLLLQLLDGALVGLDLAAVGLDLCLESMR